MLNRTLVSHGGDIAVSAMGRVLSLSRQMLCLIAILPLFFGLRDIFFAFPLADAPSTPAPPCPR